MVFVVLILQLFVNPVHAVVQLRPSMEYLDSGGSQKRNNPDVTVKGPNNDVRSGQSSKQVLLYNPYILFPKSRLLIFHAIDFGC
jgi:Sin-like protein